MPDETAPRKRRKRSRGALNCCGFTLVGLVACLIAFVIVFKVNNKPPNIAIPTPMPPNPNGWDDFVRAGKMAQGMKNKAPASMSGPPQQITTLHNYRACALEAEPILAVMRQGF